MPLLEFITLGIISLLLSSVSSCNAQSSRVALLKIIIIFIALQTFERRLLSNWF